MFRMIQWYDKFVQLIGSVSNVRENIVRSGKKFLQNYTFLLYLQTFEITVYHTRSTLDTYLQFESFKRTR